MHVKAKISLVHVGVHVLFVCFIGIFQLNLRNPSHEAMTPGLVKRLTKSLSATLGFKSSSSLAKVTTGTEILSIAPKVSLQKARSWDEGVASNFSTTPLIDIFKVPTFSALYYFCTILTFKPFSSFWLSYYN